MPEVFSNAAQTTLADDLSLAATTLSVVSALAFPPTGDFRILIDQELLKVTAVVGSTFTVVRAAEPVAGLQVAAAHQAGAQVTCVLTAGALEALEMGAGSGTVTTVSVATANGFAGSVTNPTTTPAVTLKTTVTGLLKGNGTAVSAAVADTDYATPAGVVNYVSANYVLQTTTVNGSPLSGNVSVTDASLSTSDITTNNVSTSKHGFAPKAPNDATKYLDGTGAYSTPAGGTTYSADGVTLALTGTTFSIHTGGVGTSQLASGAVSYVKIQNVAASALLGNPTGSAAAPSEITLGTNLSFSGSVLNASITSSTAISYVVSQSAHGFSQGNWLKLVSSDTYALAKADAAANADYIGIVSSVVNSNTFILTISGEVSLLPSLTVGNYFGDPSTAGAMATSAPTSAGQVQILLGRAVDSTTFVVDIKQGMVLSALTNHGVVVGTGTGVAATATGATGVPLIGQGGSADPVFQGTAVKIDSHFGAITADTDASTVTMDLSVSDWHTLLMTSAVGGNRTLAVSNPTVGQQFAIVLQQPASGGPCTVTWFSGILWSGGTVPTLTTTASKRDVFGFKCIATNVYLGFVMGPNF